VEVLGLFWDLWAPPLPRRSFKRIILFPCRSSVLDREFSGDGVRLPLIESLGVLRPSDRDLDPSELGVLARRDSFFTLLRLELDFSRLSFFADFLRSSLRDRLRRLRREEVVFDFSLVLDDLDFREDR